MGPARSRPTEADALAALVFPVYSLLIRAIRSQGPVRPKGFTLPQARIIARLAVSAENVRISDLTEYAGVTQATMTLAIQKLVKMGVVIKKEHPEDRRAASLSLSAKGRAVADAIRAKMSHALGTLCSDMPAEDRRRLAESLECVAGTLASALRKRGLE